MKFYKQIIILILIIFFQTETLLSKNNLFNVNNIKLEKEDKISNNALADKAIKESFKQLISKILLQNDSDKLSDLKLTSIRQLVTYYQISNIYDDKEKKDFVNFSVTFDKDKIHDLFFKRGISYSEILDNELYVLPVLIKDNEVNIFNNNFFYENWNKIYEDDLIEFILPLENIEIIQKISNFKNNLIDLNIVDLFKEYTNKNLALVLIEDDKNENFTVYIKTKIEGKKISKSLKLKKQKSNYKKNYQTIITDSKKELIDLIKSKNLIDIRTPSFIKVKLNFNKKNNLVELNSRISKIDSIENIYVQEFNKDYMNLKIKYLGKLEKIISLLKKNNIELKLTNESWIIKPL